VVLIQKEEEDEWTLKIWSCEGRELTDESGYKTTMDSYGPKSLPGEVEADGSLIHVSPGSEHPGLTPDLRKILVWAFSHLLRQLLVSAILLHVIARPRG
jgi:hypothetical protein